jgi:hypothetical protein
MLLVDVNGLLSPTCVAALRDAQGNRFASAAHLYLYLKYMYAAFPHARAARLAKEFFVGGVYGGAELAPTLLSEPILAKGLELDKAMWCRMRGAAAAMALNHRYDQDPRFRAALLETRDLPIRWVGAGSWGDRLMLLRTSKRS